MFSRATNWHGSRENKWIHFILSEFKTQTQRKLKKTNGVEKALASYTCAKGLCPQYRKSYQGRRDGSVDERARRTTTNSSLEAATVEKNRLLRGWAPSLFCEVSE